jgi:hypothetical protein
MKERKEWIVQCKVSDTVHQRLDKIREQYGFKSIYEVMQSLLSLYMRYISTPIEEGGTERAELHEMFKDFGRKGQRLNIAGVGHEDRLQLVAGIGILRQQETGTRLLKTLLPMGEDRYKTDYSTDTALRTVLKAADRDLYERLCDVGQTYDERRVTRIIESLVDEHENRWYIKSVHEGFEDDENIPPGQALMREH